MGRLSIKGLYCIIDSTYLPIEEMRGAAIRMMDGGARILQLRAKGLDDARLLKAARILRETSKIYNAVFIMNDRVDIAMLSGADGVHLGQDDMGVSEARGLLGGGALIGLSTHNAAEAIEAGRLGADYISFGPVFHTKTKKDAQSPKGIDGLTAVRAATGLPIVAIGGITEDNLEQVIGAGARSAAVISDILLSTDITHKTASLVKKFL